MQYLSRLGYFLIFPLPLRDGNFFGAVPASQTHKAILKHSRLMIKKTLILRTLCTRIKANLGLIEGRVHNFERNGTIEARAILGQTAERGFYDGSGRMLLMAGYSSN